MEIDIERISAAQRDDEFWKKHAAFQRLCDETKRDIRAKFIHSVHESAHAVYLRRSGWKVKLHGPLMYYEDGELRTALGAVQQLEGGRPLLDWEIAKKSVAGFVSVETLTGQPNEQTAIDGDIHVLMTESKATGERLEELVRMGEILVRCELKDPAFVRELEAATREYEREIFHTDETWSWAWKEYRLDLPLSWERYTVGLSALGYLGLLVDDGKQVRLFFEGNEYGPSDWVRSASLEAHVFEPSRKGAERVVQRWNEQVRNTRNGKDDRSELAVFSRFAYLNTTERFEGVGGFQFIAHPIRPLQVDFPPL
jgi:hypothetical protein